MKRLVKRTLLGLGGTVLFLICLVVVLNYVLLDRPPSVPETTDVAFDLDRVRALATAQDGALPLRLNLLEIAETPFYRTLVFAGGGFDVNHLYFSSLQLVYEDGTIVIDPVHSKAVQDIIFPGAGYDEAAFDTLQEALRDTRFVLTTHEHLDHVGGIGRAPHRDALRDRVLLTPEQIAGLREEHDAASVFEGFLDDLTPLAYDRCHVVAPGLVLIKMPGHTPGTQVIYVRLRNGEEFLLVGDIVWHMDNVRNLIGRPWLANIFGEEDGHALAHQLRLLHDLDAARSLHLLVAHDRDQHHQYVATGLIGDGFD